MSFYQLLFHVFLFLGPTSYEKLQEELCFQLNIFPSLKQGIVFLEKQKPELELAVEEPYQRAQFVGIWEAINEVSLDHTREDEIRWMWTPDGEYSAKSPYLARFQGSMPKLTLLPIQRAKKEPKCRFLAWTLLHKKILTTNNLLRRGWLHDPICKLCKQELEIIDHFLRIVCSPGGLGLFTLFPSQCPPSCGPPRIVV